MKGLKFMASILLVLGFSFLSVMLVSAEESTPPDNGICPVHGIKMERVKLRVVYGMPSEREFEEMRIGPSIFPYGRDYVLAGCVVKSEKSRNGFICTECVKARDVWIALQDRWNLISRASQAGLEEFFTLVNSRDVDEAMKSMAPAMVRTPEEREAWRRHLAAIRSIHILDVEPASVDDWHSSRHIFKVTLEAYVEDAPDAPIPFFGWQDNPNVRWITMELDSRRRWVVAEIATGFAGPAALPNTLPNGLQLTYFEIKVDNPVFVGSTAKVEITLKNVATVPISFNKEFGMFVGARCKKLSNANNKDFGHTNEGYVLAPGKSVTYRSSRTLDEAGNWWFWPAFNINGQWGPFNWLGKTLCVLLPKADTQVSGATLTVGQVLANPSRYDQKPVTVKGRALIIRKKTSSDGQPWMLINFFDMTNDKQVINVFGPGHSDVNNGDIIQVTGIFKAKSLRGRYHFDNEIESSSDKIVRLEKSKY